MTLMRSSSSGSLRIFSNMTSKAAGTFILSRKTMACQRTSAFWSLADLTTLATSSGEMSEAAGAAGAPWA